jgi:hypothetical protein
VITPDKATFDKAVSNVQAGTADYNKAWVGVIAPNPSFRTWEERSEQRYAEDSFSALGTLFQLGVETGIEYQKLLDAEGKVADAKQGMGMGA